jgi:hypothetical protein
VGTELDRFGRWETRTHLLPAVGQAIQGHCRNVGRIPQTFGRRVMEKSVTLKTELPDRRSLGHRVLQSRNSVKHPAVTMITDSVVQAEQKARSFPARNNDARLQQGEARVSRKLNSRSTCITIPSEASRPAEHSSCNPESYFQPLCDVRTESIGKLLEVEHKRSQTDLEARLTYNDPRHLQRGVAKSVDFFRMIATTKWSGEAQR